MYQIKYDIDNQEDFVIKFKLSNKYLNRIGIERQKYSNQNTLRLSHNLHISYGLLITR